MSEQRYILVAITYRDGDCEYTERYRDLTPITDEHKLIKKISADLGEPDDDGNIWDGTRILYVHSVKYITYNENKMLSDLGI